MVNLMYKDTDNTWKSVLDIFYPVGSLYFSTNYTSPASVIGGTWTKIENALLGATGDKMGDIKNYNGSYRITVNQMPAHSHTAKLLGIDSGSLNSNVSYAWSALRDINLQQHVGGTGSTYSSGGARTLFPIISQLLFGIVQLKKQFFPRGDVK